MNTALRLRPRVRQRSADCSVALCVVLDSRSAGIPKLGVERFVRQAVEGEIRRAVEVLENTLCRNLN